jgi:hypothetical protein
MGRRRSFLFDQVRIEILLYLSGKSVLNFHRRSLNSYTRMVMNFFELSLGNDEDYMYIQLHSSL